MDTQQKVANKKTRQATPECTHPIRGSESQTSYPRVPIVRQAIPGFNEKPPWIKGTAEPKRGEGQGREEE